MERTSAVVIAVAGCAALLLVFGGDSVKAGVQSVAGSLLQLDAIEDSADYWIYRYSLSNPVAGQHPLAAAYIDLVDPSATGQPVRLPSSGVYDSIDAHGRTFTRTDRGFTVPLGASTPGAWKLVEMTDGIAWGNVRGVAWELDGLEPGSTLAGFALRSPFLPGLRSARTEPAWAACCAEPWGTPEENPDGIHHDPASFAETFEVPAPTHSPDALGLPEIVQQLTASCTTLGWITNQGVCNSLQVKLDAVAANLAAGNPTAASNELVAFANELDALNVKFISPEAYWMLKVNAEYLAGQM